MAESGAFKTLNDKDVVSTRTLLHEAIPITGTIVSGTYGVGNVKTPAHGMFQSVYDYPYLSSSANHIFDVTVGVSTKSTIYAASNTQYTKKKNIYNQMSQILVGYDHTGSILHFDADGNILAGGTKYEDVFIIPFSRLLVKDEIKKGTFSMTLGVNASHATPFASKITITDANGSDSYLVNSPVGEYGILRAAGTPLGTDPSDVGLLYYQAGIAILTASIFSTALDTEVNMNGAGDKIQTILATKNIETAADLFRHRLHNVQFNNTTELNSTIYFCRANHNEFNYSTNPTYTNASKIRVKTNSTDEPVSYITTIGLYNDKNELMATAKLSEPLKKSPSTEFTIRCRLDY